MADSYLLDGYGYHGGVVSGDSVGIARVPCKCAVVRCVLCGYDVWFRLSVIDFSDNEKEKMRRNNKAYGTTKEREYIKLLLEDGATEVIRAGASRSHHEKGVEGNYDLIANFGKHSVWVQVKAGSKAYVMAQFSRWKKKINDGDIKLPCYHYPMFVCWIERDSWYEFDGYDTEQGLRRRNELNTGRA